MGIFCYWGTDTEELSMDKVLDVVNVTKIYPNGKKANTDINLEVRKGEIVGLIGPNGAGKTTLLRQILGLLKPTEGSITLLGKDIVKDPSIIKQEVGYEPQYPLYFPSLTVEESIGFALKFKGQKGDTLSKKLSQIIELLCLGEVRKYYGYQLSPGLIKLQLLGVALAQSNSFLVLDEPTSMIDIINKNHIWEVLSESKADKSLLIASHDMNEVKRLCDRIYLIANGKVIAEGTPEQISGLLRLPCKFSFSTSQSDLTETLLISKKIEYSLTNAIFYLSVDELNKGIDLIKEINDQTSITYIQFEAPSFDETIMKLVENSHE